MPERTFFPKLNATHFCRALYVLAETLGMFNGGSWATLGIGGGVFLFLGTWAADQKTPWPPQKLSLFALAALGIFAVELPLSSAFVLSAKTWLQLATIFMPLLLLTTPRLQQISFSDRFIPTVALAAGVGAIALGCELLSGGFLLHLFKKHATSLTEYNRGIAHAVILAFPLLAGLWISGKKQAAALVALALLFPASLTESHTAKLALIAGAACVAFSFYRPLWVKRGLGFFSVAISGWPFYAQALFSTARDTVEKLPFSWRHRIEIWDYLSYRIAERPLFGWGLGTTHTLDFTQPHGELYQMARQAAPHAHNFITELWVETGLPGLAVGVAFLLGSLRAAYNIAAPLRPFALGGWMAAVIVSLFGFDFWTDALWSAFALSAFVFGMLQQKIESGGNLRHA